MPGSIHHMLVSTAAGLVLLGSTAALAEQKDTMIGEPAVQRTDARSADVKHSGLTGGFYADKNKGDGWYYDFYEGPSAGWKEGQSAGGKGDPSPEVAGLIDRECQAQLEKLCEGVQPGGGRVRKCFEANEGKLTPSCRTQVYDHFSETTAIVGMTAMGLRKEGEPTSKIEPTSTIEPKSKLEPKSKIRPDAIRTSGKVQFVDAAHPVDAQRSSRHGQESAFTRYYDEPWYYEQRDASYTMPVRAARDDSSRSTDQAQEVIKGNITHVKQVRNRTWGGQDTVVEIKPAKGNLTIVDLGPTQPLLDMALAKQDSIAVTGPTEHIGPYSVLMANTVKSGANKVTVNREGPGVASDRKEATGRIERFSDVKVRGTEQMHRIAAIKGDDGRLMLVDLGPATAGNVPANAAPGDRMSASGPVATVGNYPVLFADRISIDDAVPVTIARPDGDYPGASRRDMEASQTLESPNTPQPKNMPQAH